MFNLPNKLRAVSKFIRDQPKPLRQNRVHIAAHSHHYMYKKPSLGFILEKENIGEIIENELNNNHFIYDFKFFGFSLVELLLLVQNYQ